MIYELQKNEYSEIAGHTVIYETNLLTRYVRNYRVMELARKIFEDLDPEIHFLRRPYNQARVAVEIIPVLDCESGNLNVIIQHKEQTSYSRSTPVCQFVKKKVIVQDWGLVLATGKASESWYVSVQLAEKLKESSSDKNKADQYASEQLAQKLKSHIGN